MAQREATWWGGTLKMGREVYKQVISFIGSFCTKVELEVTGTNHEILKNGLPETVDFSTVYSQIDATGMCL
ncbi:hypothetical protein RSOLAG1IB_10650 [Rhizoctonia solani AG-1 IB]|uniref:Uncharacterized protein n=1 Tax=Thanatephorus cucumeris (strain AG1-IB / isolate 7/3/14) TaxID=1108050 RepID=A0A0B7FYJ1_THACB|nr:hypothetical protein RSOLAG1IB_10650 [Rhizoctonia solani AG-1 IB]